MSQLTTPHRFVLSAVALVVGCYHEDTGPYLPYGSSSSSTTEATGSETAADTSGTEAEPESVG